MKQSNALKRRAEIIEQQPSKAQERRAAQAEMIAQSRRDSVLDRMIPLCAFGPPTITRPEFGLDVVSYFKRKAARGERGAYDPLWRFATERFATERRNAA
jgi:hypothetical protein